MGGRGASGGSAGRNLSQQERSSITKGIKSHTAAENDRAERNLERNLSKEGEVVNNARSYIMIGRISDTNDPWFQGHVEAYTKLSAQLKWFRQERKRLKR